MHKRIIGWIRTHRPQVIIGAVWLVLLVMTWLYINSRGLTVLELIGELRRVLNDVWYGPLIYILAYLLRPLIAFPATGLTALAGLVFGLGWGFVYALIAGTLSAVIPYFFGRWFSGEGEVTDRAQETRIGRFLDLMQRHPFQSILTMRLLYLPYDLVSLVAGGLKLPFVSFISATALSNIGGTLVYVSIGASIDGDLANSELSLNPALIIFSLAVLIVSLLLSRVVNKVQGLRNHVEPQPDF